MAQMHPLLAHTCRPHHLDLRHVGCLHVYDPGMLFIALTRHYLLTGFDNGQGAGGGLMASASSGKLGNTVSGLTACRFSCGLQWSSGFLQIFMIGITIQLISFVVFVIIFLWFLHKVRTEDSSTWCKDEGKGWRRDWRVLSVAIGISCVGVLVRILLRESLTAF